MIAPSSSSGARPTFGVFLQARLGSTRLKEKVLLRLGDRSVIEHAMIALKGCHAPVNLLLTDEQSSERLAPAARACGFTLIVGSPDDVLDRYLSALERHPVDLVVRATGDNPLVSSELALMLLEEHRRAGADFSGYVGMPMGLGVEVVSASALRIEGAEAVDPYEREHVNPYLYRHPDRFRVLRPEVPAAFRLPEGSVTLDTSDDYRYLLRLFDELYRGEPIPVDRLLEWLERNPRDTAKDGYQSGRTGADRPISQTG